MLIATVDTIPGKKIELIGFVRGTSSTTGWFYERFKDEGGKLKELVYKEFDFLRRNAIINMQTEAERLGADAVVNVRYSTAEMSVAGATEMTAYGTAVKFVKEK